MKGQERAPTDTMERRVGFEQISEARRSNDKERLRKVIREFLYNESVVNSYEIYLAGFYAWRDLSDDEMIERAIEREKQLNSWKHVVYLYNICKKDRTSAVEAKKTQIEYLMHRGELLDVLDAVIPSSLITDEEKVGYYRRVFNEYILHEEHLRAALLAKKFQKYGFSDDEIFDSAKRAYQQALRQPIIGLAEDDSVSITDADLIVDEFGLDRDALTS